MRYAAIELQSRDEAAASPFEASPLRRYGDFFTMICRLLQKRAAERVYADERVCAERLLHFCAPPPIIFAEV